MDEQKKRKCHKCIWCDICNTKRRKGKPIKCEHYYPVDEDEEYEEIIEMYREEYREEYIEDEE